MPYAATYGTRVGSVEILGRKLPVFCSRSGRFVVLDINDEIVYPEAYVEALGRPSPTIEAAESSARSILSQRRVKVAVEFWFTNGTRGVAYGIHASNGDVLAEGPEGKERLRSRPSGTPGVLDGDAPRESVERLIHLRATIAEAQNEAREIEQRFAVNLGALVQEEINKAQEGA